MRQRRKGGGGENRRYRLAASMRAHLQEGAFDGASSWKLFVLYIIFLSRKFCTYLFLSLSPRLSPFTRTCTRVLSITEDTFVECTSRGLNSPIHLNLIRSTSHRNASIRKLSARNNSSRSLVSPLRRLRLSPFVFREKLFARNAASLTNSNESFNEIKFRIPRRQPLHRRSSVNPSISSVSRETNDRETTAETFIGCSGTLSRKHVAREAPFH